MQSIYVVFGTESGNAQGLAERAGEALEKAGLSCAVVDMLDFAPENLESARLLLVITSTYGNGNPPSNAEAFHAYLMKKAPALPNVSFSVCGLGDTTYERFAQCGKDFDRRLGELGATRILDRKDCDVDYEEPFEEWLGAVVPKLRELHDIAAAAVTASTPPPSMPPVSKHVDAPGTRRNPVPARVLVNEKLNAEGSTKETRHVVLSLEDHPIQYEVGDSIGVWPENDPTLVEEILRLTDLRGSEPVKLGEVESPLAELLARRLEIQEPDVRLIDKMLGTVSAAERQGVTRSHHVIDLLGHQDVRWTATELAHHLRPLAPRLYSIASSPLAHPGEVHLLVDIVRYELGERARMGVASRLVTERTPAGATLSIYHHPSPSFHLAPADRDILMIGPGTGVAPFRAFLEHRLAERATGRSWLFFGARNRAHDFFYQRDFAKLLQAGTLTRLDLAFSRDQDQKVYVQHRLRDSAGDVARWIRSGAYVYVCGDAKRMAPDVHATLREILASEGGKSEIAAAAELEQIAAGGRYLRDVY